MSTFVCDRCGEEFENEWTLEEAALEYFKKYKRLPPPTAELVCDKCYERENNKEIICLK